MDIDVLLVPIPLMSNLDPSSKMSSKNRELFIKHESLIVEHLINVTKNHGVNLPTKGFVDLGLLSIAGHLLNEGINVFLFDTFSCKNILDFRSKLIKFINKNEISIIGMGPYTYQIPIVVEILQEVKKINPGILTVLGGPHATFDDIALLKRSNCIDIIVRGEGEWTFSKIINSMNGKGIENIRGITYKKHGKIKRNANAPLGNLDDLSIPAYHLLLKKHKMNCGHIFISRGCPFNCSFCSEKAFWGKPRYKKPVSIINELLILTQEYGIKGIRFADDNFTSNKLLMSDLYERIKKEKIHLDYLQIWTRGDKININTLKNVNFGSVVELCIGIESANDEILKIMNKKQSFETNVRALQKIKENKMVSHSFWIMGHPGANIEREIESTKAIKWLIDKKLCLINETSIFTPYPGTPIFNNPEKYGITIRSKDWSKYCENPPQFPPVYQINNLNHSQIINLYQNRLDVCVRSLSKCLEREG